MKKTILILFLLASYITFSQDVFMQDGIVSQCTGNFYDSFGPSANYTSDESFVLTICPPMSGDRIQLDFTLFNTQLGSDIMTIYDGDSTAAPIFGSFSGGTSASPGLVQASALNTSGCLTIMWVSDNGGNGTGWEAGISCFTPCQTILGRIDSTVPAFDTMTNRVNADVNEAITFNSSATFTTSGAGALYAWDFGDGTTGNGTSVTHAYATAGVFIVTLIVTDTNPNGCSSNPVRISVLIGASLPGNPFVDAGPDMVIGCNVTCTDITADFLQIGQTSTYTISQIPFVPPFPFQGLSNSLNPNEDDAWSNVENLPFDFCFFNNIETQFQIGSNGVIRFDVNPSDTGIGSNDYELFNNNLPNNFDEALAEGNVFTPCHDIDPTESSNEQIAWEIIGSAPNRVLAVSFYNVPMYECTNLIATHMAVFYETTNVIDIYIKNKPTCNSWQDGKAVVGIQNDAGTSAFVPPGRNITNSPWTTADEAWRFSPAGTSVIDFAWLDSAGTVLGTAPTLNVCPTVTTTYTARVIYTNCNGNLVTLTDDVTVSKDVPFAVDLGADQNLCEGDPDVVLNADIGSTTATYQWALNGIDFPVETNPTLTVASPNSGTYTVTVTDQSCSLPESIVVTFFKKPVVSTISDYTLCDDDVLDDFTEFDLSAKDTEAVNGQTDLNVSYHLTQADADSGASPLPTLYTNTADPQTIYVRIENSNNSPCFVTTTFDLIVTSGIVLNQPNDLVLCDTDGSNDGFTTFDLNSQTPIILGAITGVTLSYHSSQEDANDNVSSVAGLYVNTSNPQTIYVRVQDDANPLCFRTLTFDLILNSLPNVINPSPLQVCDDNVADGFTAIDLETKNDEVTGGNQQYVVSYHLTQSDADSNANPLNIPYTNTSNPQTVYVRVENDTTGCYDTTTLEIDVEQAPIAFVPTPLEYCDPDSDGLGEFILTDADMEITGGVLGLTVTFHETLAEAESNTNPQNSPYNNSQAYLQTLYARVESSSIVTDCATIVPLDLIVKDTPQIATLSPLEICDNDDDGFSNFDLTDKNSEIFGSQNPAEYILSYHTSQSDADSGVSAIANSSNYMNLINPQPIYVRLVGLNGCSKTGQFQIRVVLPPTAVLPTPLNLCDDEVADQITVFDLTSKDSEITGNNGNWTVSYYLTDADAQAGTNVISPASGFTNIAASGNAVNPQTLYVRVTDSNTGCLDFTTLNIQVLPNPSPGIDPMDMVLCDDVNTGDGKEVFDLTSNEMYIINGESGVAPTYHTTIEDAESGINSIGNPMMYTNTISPQTIYVRVTNSITGCYAIVDFDIMVNPLPEVVALADYILCEINTDGFAQFDLNSKTAEVLNGQDPAIYEVTYHSTRTDADNLTGALPSQYTNISNPQQLFVAITNTVTGCSISTPSFNLEVDNGAQANSDTDSIVQVICDNIGDNDGLGQFDLTANDVEVLDGQNPSDFIVTYYAIQSDAELGMNPIPYTYENISNPQVIYARVDNDTPDSVGMDSSICFEVTQLTLKVNLKPIFDLDDKYTLCVNTNGTEVLGLPVLNTGLSLSSYTFEWSLDGNVLPNETRPSLTASQDGTYSVVVTNISTGCLETDSAEVEESSPPTVLVEVVTQAFSENHVIVALATGNGDYEYSLDEGPWQSSGTFEDVSFGEHTVTARDINGCGESDGIVTVLDYPHFFTPNGDGRNERWNIVGFADQSNAKIFIFDRFGKLLKQISPSGNGWNGTYNGSLMPSSDYWFAVEYIEPLTGEQKQFRAHFTLKR